MNSQQNSSSTDKGRNGNAPVWLVTSVIGILQAISLYAVTFVHSSVVTLREKSSANESDVRSIEKYIEQLRTDLNQLNSVTYKMHDAVRDREAFFTRISQHELSDWHPGAKESLNKLTEAINRMESRLDRLASIEASRYKKPQE